MKHCHRYLKALHPISLPPLYAGQFLLVYYLSAALQSSKYLSMLSRAVVLKLGSIEPPGFDGALSRVRGKSKVTWNMCR